MVKKKQVKRIMTKKPVGTTTETDTLRVSDLVITDEFRTISKTADGKAAAQMPPMILSG